MSKRLRKTLEYAGAKFLLGCLSLLPQCLLRPFGAALGWAAFSIFRIRRSVTIENIRLALGGDKKKICSIARRSYMNLGRSMVEFAAFKRFSTDRIRRMVTSEGSDFFEVALEAGKGAVLFTGHFGNWELLAAWAARSGYPFHVLVGVQSNKRVDDLINELRRSQDIHVISPDEGLRRALRVLTKNEFVAILADQDARRAGVFVDFLGRPASTFRGPARLAVQQGCPIISGFIVRSGRGRHVAKIQPPLWPRTDLPREEAMRDLTQRYTRHLEAFVREHPDHYFWAHRRWKTKP